MNPEQPFSESLSPTEQVVRLKRLLVTLKQKYESALQSANQQLQTELSEKQTLQLEMDQRLKDLKQLKEKLAAAGVQLSEALESKVIAENHLHEIQMHAQDRSLHSTSQNQQLMESLIAEQEASKAELLELRRIADESEANLKVAQQHLGKKVKETALLTDQLNNYRVSLFEQQRSYEAAKSEITHLQNSVEALQSQEKRLQEQLHEALKNYENQAVKWEEKYFNMYDKWQSSEAKILELKKLEEKHQQIQAVIANLGSFL